MFAKKGSVSSTSTRTYKTKLEHLYAHRSALDALIESLEEYERYRIRRLYERKRKTA